MKLKEGEIDLLRSITAAPKTARAITHSNGNMADIQRSSRTLTIYLGTLTELGLITAPKRWDGVYEVTAKGERYLTRLPKVAQSQVWGPCSTKGAYVTPKWPVRAGGDDHQQYRSRGV